MISIKIFDSFDKNLEKIFKDIIKNKINIFQSEEWIKSNIKIYNKNKCTKIIFVVYFKENQPIIFFASNYKKYMELKFSG